MKRSNIWFLWKKTMNLILESKDNLPRISMYPITKTYLSWQWRTNVICHSYFTSQEHVQPIFSSNQHIPPIFNHPSTYSAIFHNGTCHEHIPAIFQKLWAYYSSHIPQARSIFHPYYTSHELILPTFYQPSATLPILSQISVYSSHISPAMRLFYLYSISHQPILHNPSTILPILHHVLLIFPAICYYIHQSSDIPPIPPAISVLQPYSTGHQHIYPHCTSNLLLYPYSTRALLLYLYSASHLQICPCVAVVT